jgi:hypothetical protein
MSNPKNAQYFEQGRAPGSDYDKGANQYTGNTKLKDGYSRVAHQDAPEPVSFTQTKTAKKGGGFNYGEKQYIYKKVEQKQAPAQQAQAPAAEKPKDDLVIKQRGPVKNSPEIQDAKERVNKFQQNSATNSVYTPSSFQSNQPSLDLEKYKFNSQGAN